MLGSEINNCVRNVPFYVRVSTQHVYISSVYVNGFQSRINAL